MISGHGNIETAVSAIKRGAYDYIEKPFKADRLVLVAERALEASQAAPRGQGAARAERRGRPSSSARRSAMNQLRQTIEKVAPTNSRIMISGAVGLRQGAGGARHPRPVGRAARAVRRAQCGDDHAGAHGGGAVRHRADRTAPAGARSARSRRRMAARSISTRSPTCRARRRARSCASWSTRPSSASAAPRGSMSTCASSPRPAATSSARSPRARFREDLFHRLAVVPIRVPALAERREDIPDLVAPLHRPDLARRPACRRARSATTRMAVLQAHDWPGNIRQLRNNVERLLILARGDAERGDHRRHAAGRDRRDAADDAGQGRGRAPDVAAAARCPRDLRARVPHARRSTASAATSRAPPNSSAWSARRCTAS